MVTFGEGRASGSRSSFARGGAWEFRTHQSPNVSSLGAASGSFGGVAGRRRPASSSVTPVEPLLFGFTISRDTAVGVLVGRSPSRVGNLLGVEATPPACRDRVSYASADQLPSTVELRSGQPCPDPARGPPAAVTAAVTVASPGRGPAGGPPAVSAARPDGAGPRPDGAPIDGRTVHARPVGRPLAPATRPGLAGAAAPPRRFEPRRALASAPTSPRWNVGGVRHAARPPGQRFAPALPVARERLVPRVARRRVGSSSCRLVLVWLVRSAIGPVSSSRARRSRGPRVLSEQLPARGARRTRAVLLQRPQEPLLPSS